MLLVVPSRNRGGTIERRVRPARELEVAYNGVRVLHHPPYERLQVGQGTSFGHRVDIQVDDEFLVPSTHRLFVVDDRDALDGTVTYFDRHIPQLGP